MQNQNNEEEANDTSELPPLFKTWKQLYVFVLVEFLLCLCFFFFLTYQYQ
jgi:hypothetical protein